MSEFYQIPKGGLIVLPPVITSELQQVLTYVARRFDQTEEKFMARVDDLQTSLDTLTANVADYTSDVMATLADIMTTLDAALANDATDAATIAELRTQLAEVSAGVDSALTKVQALNAAVSAADVAVDRPAP